ncbi:MAG: efflux RND transporter permease subunit, partial [Deltaproteobacteria bacterium]
NRPGEGNFRNPSRGVLPFQRWLFAPSAKIFGFFLEPLWQIVDRMLRSTAGLYSKALVFSVANKKKVVFGSIVVLVTSAFLYPVIGQEFLPQVDQGSFVVQVTTPPGTTLESTGKTASEVREILSAEPEVKDVFVNIGYDKKEKTESVLGETRQNVAKETAVLREERKRSTRQVVNAVRAKIAGIPGIQVDYLFNQDVTQFTRQKQRVPEVLEISGPNLATLRRLSDQVVKKLKTINGLNDVASSLGSEEPEVQVSIDREKAASYGLSVKEIGDTLKTAMEGDDGEAIKRSSDELMQASHKVAEAMYQQASQAGAGSAQQEAGGATSGGAGSDEEVVEAEFEEVDEDKK